MALTLPHEAIWHFDRTLISPTQRGLLYVPFINNESLVIYDQEMKLYQDLDIEGDLSALPFWSRAISGYIDDAQRRA